MNEVLHNLWRGIDVPRYSKMFVISDKKSLIKLVAVAGSFVQKFGRTLVHRISFWPSKKYVLKFESNFDEFYNTNLLHSIHV